MANSSVFFDPVTKVINGGEKHGDSFDSRGLGWVLFDSMKKWSEEDKIAQIETSSGLQDSFFHFMNRCIKTAIAMKNFGIQPGDVITICSNNNLNATIPLIASCLIGAVTAPTDPTLCVEDTAYLLNMVQPKLVFTSKESEDLIQDALNNNQLNNNNIEVISFSNDAKTSKFKTFNSFMENNKILEEVQDFKPVYCDDITKTCLILFSSGTTGLPKGICLNHKFIMNSANGLAAADNIGTNFMGFASLYWISTMMIVFTCLIYGFTRMLCLEFKAEKVWEDVDKYQVSFLFIAPVQAIKTLRFLSNKGKNLLYMMIGGGSIAPEYLQALRDDLPDTLVLNSYGQTEIGCITVLKCKDKNYNKLTTCGQPVKGLKMRIVDPDTDKVLDLNQEGEIRIKPYCPINGYYKRDACDVWDEDGYMKTGDLGYFDDDLCLYVTDRVKEMFKYMSFHIVPSKLEMILQTHPAVELAVVIGIPHITEDNHALGIVTLNPGVQTTPLELEKFVETKVDERNRLRGGVLIVKYNELPMTPTGKIKRKQLKDLVIKQRFQDLKLNNEK